MGIVAQRVPVAQVDEQRAQVLRLLLQRGIARLGLLLDSFQPALDVLVVGDEELQLERLEIAGRVRVLAPAVQDGEQRVDLAETAEKLTAGARHVDDPHGGRRDLLGRDDRGDLVEPRVGDRRHADVLLA